jgi:hypothetical protein
MMTVISVCDFASQETFFFDYFCVVNFFMIYLLTCKHEEEQANGGWLIRVSFDVIYVCVILHLKRHECVKISV